MLPPAPQPRDYDEYGAYLDALQEWEWQCDQLDDPDGAKAREAAKREEIWLRFAAEQRVPRCIPSCRKPLCLEREGCIWVELQIIQDLCNADYFDGRLSEPLFFVDPESLEHRTKLGLCSVLPPLWQKDGSREHRALRFFLNVWDVINFEPSTPPIIAFMQDIYRTTAHILGLAPFDDAIAATDRITHALHSHTILPALTSSMLREEWEQVQT